MSIDLCDINWSKLTSKTFNFMQHILYRQKEQFSDGVGYSWIDGLKDHAAKHVLNPTFSLNNWVMELAIVIKFMFLIIGSTFFYRWLTKWCLMLVTSTPTTPQIPRKRTTTEWSLRGSSLRQVNQPTLNLKPTDNIISQNLDFDLTQP